MEGQCLKGKVALVTGASRGIGRAIAEAFALAGAQVVANYNKSEKELSALVNELRAKGCKIEAHQADVTKGALVEKMIDEIVVRHERIDILVNNAGVKKDTFMAMMNEEEWDKVIQVLVLQEPHVRDGEVLQVSIQHLFCLHGPESFQVFFLGERIATHWPSTSAQH